MQTCSGTEPKGLKRRGALGSLWDLLVGDLQPHSVLAARLLCPPLWDPEEGGEGLPELWAARAVGGPAGKPHLSLGLSEEAEELAGSPGATSTSVCSWCALLAAASSLWVGASTQAMRFPVLNCLWPVHNSEIA